MVVCRVSGRVSQLFYFGWFVFCSFWDPVFSKTCCRRSLEAAAVMVLLIGGPPGRTTGGSPWHCGARLEPPLRQTLKLTAHSHTASSRHLFSGLLNYNPFVEGHATSNSQQPTRVQVTANHFSLGSSPEAGHVISVLTTRIDNRLAASGVLPVPSPRRPTMLPQDRQ